MRSLTHNSIIVPLVMASPKPLDQVRAVASLKHFSLKTERSYANYIKRFILFHNKRHPAGMGADEIRAFLADLALRHHVAASTQTVALSALLFLYRDVLKKELAYVEGIERAKSSHRLPVVMIYTHVLNRGGRGVRSP